MNEDKTTDEAKAKQLFQLLKQEYEADKAHTSKCTPETHAAWDAARDAALDAIEASTLAKGIFLFGRRLGMMQSIEEFRWQVEARIAGRESS